MAALSPAAPTRRIESDHAVTVQGTYPAGRVRLGEGRGRSHFNGWIRHLPRRLPGVLRSPRPRPLLSSPRQLDAP
jgi:hypothetical protein